MSFLCYFSAISADFFYEKDKKHGVPIGKEAVHYM